MIVVDTSVWIDHLRRSNDELASLLDANEVLGHAFVVGELMLGRATAEARRLLQALPQAKKASDQEVLGFIDSAALPGTGLGYVDAHLLAATIITSEARIWSLDRPLREAAARLGCGYA